MANHAGNLAALSDAGLVFEFQAMQSQRFYEVRVIVRHRLPCLDVERDWLKQGPIFERVAVPRTIEDSGDFEQVGFPRGQLRQLPGFRRLQRSEINIHHSELKSIGREAASEITYPARRVNVGKLALNGCGSHSARLKPIARNHPERKEIIGTFDEI